MRLKVDGPLRREVAVKQVTLPIRQGEVLALIGPSGCGKTTLLRSLNRLTELTPRARAAATISLDGEDVDALEVTALRRRVSMVFQQPNPFPMASSTTWPTRCASRGRKRPGRSTCTPMSSRRCSARACGTGRREARPPALRLSGGQQQRLCIARAIATRPEVLLLDEPCSALDPRSTAEIEELIGELRDEVAIVIVTHNMQQARRVGDKVGSCTSAISSSTARPSRSSTRRGCERTRDYVGGRSVKRWPAPLAIALAGVRAPSGCETTPEKSAKKAKAAGRRHHPSEGPQALHRQDQCRGQGRGLGDRNSRDAQRRRRGRARAQEHRVHSDWASARSLINGL